MAATRGLRSSRRYGSTSGAVRDGDRRRSRAGRAPMWPRPFEQGYLAVLAKHSAGRRPVVSRARVWPGNSVLAACAGVPHGSKSRSAELRRRLPSWRDHGRKYSRQRVCGWHWYGNRRNVWKNSGSTSCHYAEQNMKA